MKRYLLLLVFAPFFITACKGPKIDGLAENPFKNFSPFVDSIKKSSSTVRTKSTSIVKSINREAFGLDPEYKPELLKLDNILKESVAKVDLSNGFKQSIRLAVEANPTILAHREAVLAKRSAIGVNEAKKDFQVTGSVYSGLEDISDGTGGVAVVLNANRLVYDGGLLDSTTTALTFEAEAAQYKYAAAMDQKALELAKIWLDLDRYEKLNKKIESRLNVLGPLIDQLERVADAGVGDVSQVASAQRTVSSIRVVQTNISESYAQAKVDFLNAFGSLPESGTYNSEMISKLMPKEITKKMVENAPAIKGEFASYLAAEAGVASIIAKDKFKIGLETRLTRPFGGSGYDSDESIGLVFNKTIYNGEMRAPELRSAQANVKRAIANLQAVHREGERIVQASLQNIQSMDKAIILANNKSKITSDEIAYLRQQLIIGGSTLENVLSAEARFYDSEANIINFSAEQKKSELSILAALGLIGPALGLKP